MSLPASSSSPSPRPRPQPQPQPWPQPQPHHLWLQLYLSLVLIPFHCRHHHRRCCWSSWHCVCCHCQSCPHPPIILNLIIVVLHCPCPSSSSLSRVLVVHIVPIIAVIVVVIIVIVVVNIVIVVVIIVIVCCMYETVRQTCWQSTSPGSNNFSCFNIECYLIQLFHKLMPCSVRKKSPLKSMASSFKTIKLARILRRWLTLVTSWTGWRVESHSCLFVSQHGVWLITKQQRSWSWCTWNAVLGMEA